MSWEFDPDRPIYSQLTERLNRLIVTEEYGPGSRLPSVRDLAGQARVNPNTMQRALANLEATGLIYTERTSGRFVTEDKDLISEVKRNMAREVIKRFYHDMWQLGVSPEEALHIAGTEVKDERVR